MRHRRPKWSEAQCQDCLMCSQALEMGMRTGWDLWFSATLAPLAHVETKFRIRQNTTRLPSIKNMTLYSRVRALVWYLYRRYPLWVTIRPVPRRSMEVCINILRPLPLHPQSHQLRTLPLFSHHHVNWRFHQMEHQNLQKLFARVLHSKER